MKHFSLSLGLPFAAIARRGHFGQKAQIPPSLSPISGPAMTRCGKIIAMLGPTNTGKTHMAVQRMLSYPSGMIGLPLRLLAREVYERVCAITGAGKVALVTGE